MPIQPQLHPVSYYWKNGNLSRQLDAWGWTLEIVTIGSRQFDWVCTGPKTVMLHSEQPARSRQLCLSAAYEAVRQYLRARDYNGAKHRP